MCEMQGSYETQGMDTPVKVGKLDNYTVNKALGITRMDASIIETFADSIPSAEPFFSLYAKVLQFGARRVSSLVDPNRPAIILMRMLYFTLLDIRKEITGVAQVTAMMDMYTGVGWDMSQDDSIHGNGDEEAEESHNEPDGTEPASDKAE